MDNEKEKILLEKNAKKRREKLLAHLKQKYPNFTKRKEKENEERLKKYRPFTK